MHSNQHESPQQIAALLQTVARATVTGPGIPPFMDLIQDEPAGATDLIVAQLLTAGDATRESIEDLKHDVLALASARDEKHAKAAMSSLDDAFGNRQTDYCEAYYLVGVAVTLRAIGKARALVNLDVANILAELASMSRREKGGDRG